VTPARGYARFFVSGTSLAVGTELMAMFARLVGLVTQQPRVWFGQEVAHWFRSFGFRMILFWLWTLATA